MIDWSELRDDNRSHVLRAGIPVGGRTLTELEQVYPQLQLGTPRAEKAFLKQLQRLLPTDSKPIIATDAGFRSPWFRAVVKLGWNYVGWLRHTTRIKLDGADHWFDNRKLYESASGKPQRCHHVTILQPAT